MCDYSEAFEELAQFPLDAVPAVEARALCFDVCMHCLEFSSFSQVAVLEDEAVGEVQAEEEEARPHQHLFLKTDLDAWQAYREEPEEKQADWDEKEQAEHGEEAQADEPEDWAMRLVVVSRVFFVCLLPCSLFFDSWLGCTARFPWLVSVVVFEII